MRCVHTANTHRHTQHISTHSACVHPPPLLHTQYIHIYVNIYLFLYAPHTHACTSIPPRTYTQHRHTGIHKHNTGTTCIHPSTHRIFTCTHIHPSINMQTTIHTAPARPGAHTTPFTKSTETHTHSHSHTHNNVVIC